MDGQGTTPVVVHEKHGRRIQRPLDRRRPDLRHGAVYAENDEGVWALSEADGKELWWTRIAPKGKGGYDEGPRCTPTVDGSISSVRLWE